MVSASPRIYVVIVNYNSTAALFRCLDSIVRIPELSVLVVDNNSDITNRQLLMDYSLPSNVELSYLPDNLGFGSAVNWGLKLLAYDPHDIIWILNPDVIASSKAVLQLVSAIEEDDFNIVSPVIMTGENFDRVWFSGGSYDLRRGITSHKESIDRGISPATFVTGAAPMMRASTWESVGPFREDLFMYWEDCDWSIRASIAGMNIGVVQEASVWHEVGASVPGSGKSELWYFYMQRNRLIVCGGYHSKFGLILGAGFFATARLFVRAIREKDRRGAKLMACFDGLWAGLFTPKVRQDFARHY